MESKSNKAKIVFWVSLLGVAVITPIFIEDPYWIDVFIFMLIYAILTVSVQLVFTTGQTSFAHPGLAAIGGYCSGALVVKLGFSFWVAIVAAGLSSTLFSLIIGYPTLRLKGVYFFLVTFMFTSLIGVFMGNFWVPVFGGWRGLLNIPRPNPITIPGLFTIEFETGISFYYLTLFATLVTVLMCYRLERSRFGLVFNAIEHADVLAESVGINLMKFKILAFVTGGFFAGVAGGLFAHYQRIITPYDFELHLGILLIIYMVVGGPGTTFGALFGVIILRLLDHPLRRFGAYQVMVLGFLLLLFLMFIPGGLISLPQRIGFWIRKIKQRISER